MSDTLTTATVVRVGSPEWQAAVAEGRAVYIGRPSRGLKGSVFANRYKTPRDGTRDEVVALYKRDWETHLSGEFRNYHRALLESLRGKVLGCWCHPKRCHGHALVELLEARR